MDEFDDRPFCESEISPSDSADLNNFYLRFCYRPDGTVYHRELSEGVCPLDEKLEPGPGMSTKRASVTTRTFFADLDLAFEESDIERNEILSLVNEVRAGDFAAAKRLQEVLIPVYVYLRKKGYSQVELVR